eukprot:2727638-Pyramimonas_sp.AAC.1
MSAVASAVGSVVREPSPAKTVHADYSVGPHDSVSQAGDDDEEGDDCDDGPAPGETPLQQWMRKTSLDKVVRGVKLQRRIRFAGKAMQKMSKGDATRMNTHLQQVWRLGFEKRPSHHPSPVPKSSESLTLRAPPPAHPDTINREFSESGAAECSRAAVFKKHTHHT